MASLAARCYWVHQAAEAGGPAAERQLRRMAGRGQRAAQCLIDATMQWHRHPGQPEPCEDPGCPEASDPAAWVASWEAYWPPGNHPGT
jgi:hypothetical protein